MPELLTIPEFASLVSGDGTALGWLNVIDYGATGDGTTDDTDAIQDAIDAAFALGNATIFFPRGVYLCNGTQQGSLGDADGFSRLRIPAATMDNDEWKGITLIGESVPPLIMGTVSDIAMPVQGSIIKTTTSGGSIIGCEPVVWFATLLNSTSLTIKNLTFRTTDDPTQTAIYGRYLFQLNIQNVQVDTGTYSVVAAEPTTSTAVGIYCPQTNNAGNLYLNTVNVSGYYTGYVFYEHATGTNIFAHSCKRAFHFPGPIGHGMHFGRVMFQQCEVGIYCDGGANVTIDQFAFEMKASGWNATTYHIEETGNDYLRGSMKWHGTLSGAIQDELLTSGTLRMFSWTHINRASHAELLADGTSQTFAHATSNAVTWLQSTVTPIIGLTWSSSVNPSRIYVQASGVYAIHASVVFAANATGQRRIFINKNGAENISSNNAPGMSVPTMVKTSETVKLLKGDYIEIYADQDSGVAINLTDIDYCTPKLSITKVA